MNVHAIAQELDAALRTITPRLLAHYVGPPASVTVPCSIVALPDQIDYDQTYGRGADRITWPVLILAGKIDDRGVMDKMADFINGSGSASVKAALEGYEYDSLDSIRVVNAQLDVITWGSADFQGALFELDIFGSGTS